MNKLVVTIFGATGDLTIRKLLPALENIVTSQKEFDSMSIVAVGRRNYTSEDYLEFVAGSSAFSGDINKLRPHLVYAEVDAVNPDTYSNLKLLHEVLTRNYTNVRHIFYLAVGPDLFTTIADNLLINGLVEKGNLNQIIAFEKPFGHTYSDACEINRYLEELLDNEQLYRVDHYLGKEMVQNLLAFRFGNQIFNAIWNKEHISEVKIVVSEKEGILQRGAYYDQVGVLNDMVQSHLLQVLALLVMNKPKSLQSEDIRSVKVEAFKKMKYVSSQSLLGQYIGYRQEKGVDPNSLISTLAFLTLNVDLPQFKGVPFYIFTGKQLAKKESYIEIILKEPESSKLFAGSSPNRIKIEISPQALITMSLNSHESFQSNTLIKTELDYCYNCVVPTAIKEAYELLMVEMMHGRLNLFPSFEEIQYSWEVINQIAKDKPRWFMYEKGFDLFGGSNE